MASYLLVIGEREAVKWILTERRMAFPVGRRLGVEDLAVGDEVFLVTTRGCFHNPTTDRTSIIGRAEVSTPVRRLNVPLELIGRTFDRICDLEITALAPFRQGVELAPLVPDLKCFPNKGAWAMWLRRPLLRLEDADVAAVRARVNEATEDRDPAIREYIARASGIPSAT